MNLIPFWPTTRPIARPRYRPKPFREPDFPAMDAGDASTGLVLQGCYLPEEILRIILSFVDDKSMLQCRAVCKYWRSEVDNEVWKYKVRREECLSVNAVNAIANSIPNSWLEFYYISTKKPFGRNLLRNNSGQDKLKYWEVLSNGGDKWRIENPPIGSDDLPEEITRNAVNTKCFASSYHSCSKRQTIQLQSIGLTPRLMDEIQPRIKICEWYARRFDCGAVYEMKVELLNHKRVALHDFEHRVTMDRGNRSNWHKVSHEFKNYGPGVRYVMFYHGGTDTQFWAGHYGSKMAGASIVIELDN